MSRTDAESKRMLTFKEPLARTVREVDNQGREDKVERGGGGGVGDERGRREDG